MNEGREQEICNMGKEYKQSNKSESYIEWINVEKKEEKWNIHGYSVQ